MSGTTFFVPFSKGSEMPFKKKMTFLHAQKKGGVDRNGQRPPSL
jgi:hypothetical protein